MTTLEQFLEHAESVLTRLENLLPSQTATSVDWDSPTAAFRWRKKNGRGVLVPIARYPHRFRLPDLFFVERQKTLLEQNTRQFLQGKPANNVLLTGARGTGKSSLVKACLNEFRIRGCV